MRIATGFFAGLLVLVLAASRLCHDGRALGLAASTWGIVGALAAIVLTALLPRLAGDALGPWLAGRGPGLGLGPAVALAVSSWIAIGGAAAWVVARASDRGPAAFTGMVLGASFFVLGGTLASGGRTRPRWYPSRDSARDAAAIEGFVLFVIGVALLFAGHVSLVRRSPLVGLGAAVFVATWARVGLFVAEGLSR